MQRPLTLLNGLTPAQFMAEYWQKKPLLIRQAIPDFQGILDAETLAGMACEAEVPSRIVRCDPALAHTGKGWQVMHGPFDDEDFAQLPERDWTLLVQGVNHVLPEAQALLAQFDFIPYARLDDLMVSYAPAGGGVGPHVDSYDVFLLQGAGQRRWRISAQSVLELIPDAPLRILSNFDCEQEWLLAPGDMLYLPPNIAHWGIAEDDDCMTYSIGFRAPAARELAIEFLEARRQAELQDRLYQDPDLLPVTDPAEICPEMVDKVAHMLRELTWEPALLGPFLARYFTEPKPYVVFTPNRKLSLAKFTQLVAQHGLTLDLQSQLLHWQGHYCINGEAIDAPPEAQVLLSRLACQRLLTVADASASDMLVLLPILHGFYLAGYIHLSQ
ncbi:MAG TPA: cupin domain-containing protein [Methylophilus sp.]